jgi:peptide/nickel transport system substrate-binding protein
MAGCAGGDSDDPNATPATKQGGNLTIGLNVLPTDLNPITMTGGSEYTSTGWMYSNLTVVDPDLNLHPDLATDWEPNDPSNPTAWTFYLREDATFNHNNEPVTATDVKATFDTIADPDVGAPAKGTLGPIESVEAVDDYTVRFNLESVYGDIPKKMAKVQSRIVAEDALDNLEDLSREPAGSGPFTLENFESGQEVVFTASDDYYKTTENGDQLPYLDQVTIEAYPEASSRVTALRNGEIDIMYQVPAAQFERVNSISDVEATEIPGGYVFPIAMDTETEPFDDLRVRQAIKYAVDKEALLSVAQQGRGTVVQNTPIGPPYEYYADLDHMFGRTAEIEKANELLDEAGYGDGIELDFPLWVMPDIAAPMGPQAVALQEQLSKIGIEFEVRNLSVDRFISEVFLEEAFYTEYFGQRMTEDGILYLLLHSDGAWSDETSFNNDEFDTALENAMATVDKEEKAEYYTKCQRLVQEKGGYICAFFQNRLGATQNYVENYEFEPTTFRSYVEDVYVNE